MAITGKIGIYGKYAVYIYIGVCTYYYFSVESSIIKMYWRNTGVA